ncbi:hypothetical protein [Mesorhizobium sp. B2-5-4]|uniref:hypothetical protein n=1 Tax=Mesorhizobium sp. B2-5-4 TaxID=2589926 RepID=UPI001AEE8276|nr:hypothetical protein [Mesorhizobium sp. B2-5-4]
MDWLYDARTDCYSVQTTLSVGEYLDLVKDAYSQKGALSGQRDALKTTTAKRIRERMVADIRRGAVLPPVVIGVVVSDEVFKTFPLGDAATAADIAPKGDVAQISIIDGMQRTTALIEAVDADDSVKGRSVRVEFWLTRSVSTMIYRMLVLNTGQVPWTLARQLAVVYAPLFQEVLAKVPDIGRIHTPDKPGRRVSAGEFSADALVELYIAFNLRKTTIDAKESLSDEFSRLDFIENVSDEKFQGHFYNALNVLTALDHAFSRYDSGAPVRFGKGRNIFDGQPSRIGFISALAQHVLGRPGMDRPSDERDARMSAVESNAKLFVLRLADMDDEALGDFLRLEVLAETLDKRVGQVGRYERAVFFDAFQVLIDEEFKLSSMEPCWRAN